MIPLRYAVAADIAPLVQRLSDSGAHAPAPPGAAGQNLGTAAPSILVDSRSNSLIVRSANPAQMASVRSLIAKLDLPPQGSAASGQHLGRAPEERRRDQARDRCCAPRSAPAPAAAPAAAAATTSTQPVNAGRRPAGATAAARPASSSAAAAPISASAGPSTGGFIQADPSTNSLIITAPEPLYRQVRAMIDQLDERRAQVYIESLIVEVDAATTPPSSASSGRA